MALDDMYKEVILDHYKHPRNKRDLPGAEFFCTRNNPLCCLLYTSDAADE